MHASLIKKIAQLHSDKSKTLRTTARNEATKLKRAVNSDTTKGRGSRSISRHLNCSEAKPLIGVKRDQDTNDGGKKGEITTNPNIVDLIVQRAWKKIYDGIGGDIEQGINNFFKQYASSMCVGPQQQLEDITGDELYDHFRNASNSAAAMDGWHPKEFSYLSRKVCMHIATLLNQIEKGAPWPRSTRLARVVYLEK